MLPLLVALWSGASPVLLQDITPQAATDSETYLEVDTGDEPNLLVIQTEFWGAELFTIRDGRRQLVADICPGLCSGNPTSLTRLGARFFFLATDVPAGPPDQLWISDGTAEGTHKLAADASHLVLLQSQLVFQRPDGLWVSDGTPSGTKALTWGAQRTLVSAEATPLHRFFSVNPAKCEVFVTGEDVTNGTALPMPAGTSGCAEPLVTLGERGFVALTIGLYRFETTGAPALLEPTGTNLTRVGAGLFFFRESMGTLSLFHSTGEPGGTIPLSSVSAQAVKNLGFAAGRLVFSALVNAVPHLYSSDGTVAGTVELPLTATTTHAILPVGPVVYVVTQTVTSTALIESDGTASGTVVLQGVHPTHRALQTGHREAKGHPAAIALVADVLNEFGAFRIRPGEDPEALFLKPGNPIGGVFGEPMASGGTAWFNADGHTFQTDGTPDGSFLLSAQSLVSVAGGRPLVTDGKTVSVIAADGGTTALMSASGLAVIGRLGELAIYATDTGLFRTDGTSTTQLATLPFGARYGPVVLGDGRAVVAAGTTLWFTDGTMPGTTSVEVPAFSGGITAGKTGAWVTSGNDGVAFVTSSSVVTATLPRANPAMLTALGDDLFCVTDGSSLFRVSGTGSTVVDLVPDIRALAVYKDKLMVLGNGQLLELVGASLVLKAPARGSTYLRVAGGILFVDAASLPRGLEPSAYFEPMNVLVPFDDLSFGPGSSSPSAPVALGKKFLFFAWTPETGREPFTWEPDPPIPAAPPRGCGCTGGGAGLGLLAFAFLVTRRRRC